MPANSHLQLNPTRHVGPSRVFGVLALAEMVTWTLLIAGMIGKYILDLGEWGVRIGGGLHGFVFLGYCLVTVLVAVDQRWPVRELLLGLGSAVVPYLTVPFERRALRRGLLGERWRLRDERPSGPIDGIVAVVVRRPVPAVIGGLIVVTIVFLLLLAAGPPTEWFA